MQGLVLNNELRMNSVEVCELINRFRLEEGNETEKLHNTLMRDVREELKSLELVGLIGQYNFVQSSYINKQNKEQPCFSLNKAGIMQMLNKESAVVRYKTQQYIELLENELHQPKLPSTYKEALQQLLVQVEENEKLEIELKEKNEKIEQDKPKVTFAERVMNSKDNVTVTVLSKMISDEGFNISNRKLYDKLRGWGYIYKRSRLPIQKYVEKGYFVVKVDVIDTVYGLKETQNIKITPKGQIHIVERILEENKGDM